MLNGHGDPLTLLGADPHDWQVVTAVIAEADRMRVERDQQVAELTSTLVANKMSKVMARVVKAMAQR